MEVWNETNKPTLYCISLIKCNTLCVCLVFFFSGRVIRKWKNQAVLKLKFSLLQPSNSGQQLDFSAKYEAQGQQSIANDAWLTRRHSAIQVDVKSSSVHFLDPVLAPASCWMVVLMKPVGTLILVFHRFAKSSGFSMSVRNNLQCHSWVPGGARCTCTTHPPQGLRGHRPPVGMGRSPDASRRVLYTPCSLQTSETHC